MRPFLRNALIGAVLGGGIAAAINALRPAEEAAQDADPTMVVIRGATFGALGAVTLGWLRQRRADKKAARARAAEPAILRMVHNVADEVGPRVEDGLGRLGSAAGTARDRAGSAAGTARDRAGSAAETAIDAAGSAKERVESLVP